MYALKNTLKKSVIAIALAFPALAMAQTAQELKAELDALKQHVKKLEAMIEKVTEQKADAVKAEGGVDLAEFNRVRIKTEALEDSIEANGFKGLKISGYVDPTYIYNRNAKTASFVFLNNNSPINGSTESFGYDNTYFGSAFVSLEKELDGGSKVKLTLVPSKGTASSYNFGNIVHEATVTVPLTDPKTRLIAGQFADWTGYEAIPSNQNKLITHNLLFDFSAPNFYTGAGLEMVRDKWTYKAFVGNLNRARIDVAERRAPGVFYRGDYAKSEFVSFGFGGIHSGFDDKDQFGRLDIVEIDGAFIRGDMTLQGQLTYGRQKHTPGNGFTGDYAKWYGFSSLIGLKLTPQLESIARLDYIYNKGNGGGVLGSTFGGTCKDTTGADANCPDGRNGFGSGLVFDGTNWVVADPSQGSNRYALSLGLNYALKTGINLKMEYRYDRSSSNTFLDSKGSYRRDNHVLGFSSVVSF